MAAEREGIFNFIEPLSRKETALINTIAEAADLVR